MIGSELPATAIEGAIFQDVGGRLYIRKSGTWKELATVENAVPVGTIIQNVIPPTAMPAGWIPVNGTAQFSVTQYPALFEVPGLASYVSGTGDNRMMKLPDATGRVLMTSFNQPKALSTGGTTNNQVTLLTGNLPKHKHAVGVNPSTAVQASLHLGVGLGGGHGHVVELEWRARSRRDR